MPKGFTIKIDKKIKKLLDTTTDKGYLPQVRKEFSKRGPTRVKRAIFQDIIRGISPVKGQGKWQKYSDSYKDVIRDRAAFRTINGKVVRIGVETVRRGDSRGKQKRKRNKSIKEVVKRLNADFKAMQSPRKRVSPVNLRLSGKMLNSSFSKTIGGFLRRYRLVIGFKNKLADIHNRLGAGKSKVVRRLLPTRASEKFNNRITKTLIDELQSAVDAVAKRFSDTSGGG